MRRAALATLVAFLLASVVTVARPDIAAGAVADAPADGSSCGPDPFIGLDAILAATYPGQRFTAAIHDNRTGCDFSFHPELRIGTASVFKVEILGGVLYRAALEGRGLTEEEAELIAPMIEQSANAPASELYDDLGGQDAFAQLNDVFGLTNTDAAPPLWGNTQTTAADQVTMVRNVLPGALGPIPTELRYVALSYMTSIVPEQRWGITAGVAPGWVVAQKDGFAPADCCGWRVNSVGRVEDPRGGGYDVAILTDGWPDEPSGIAGNELVAQFVSAYEARLPVGPFATGDHFVVQQYRDLFGRDPDPYGVVFWTNAVDALGPGPVFDGLFASAEEEIRDSLAFLYLAAFDRLPDVAGFDFWTSAVASGQLSLTDVADAFVGSEEFAAPADDADFVTVLYQRVLHRDPDAAGAAYWSSLLQSGALTRADELLLFSRSLELRGSTWSEVVVFLVYRALLQRLPDPAGLAYWSDVVRTNGWGSAVLAQLIMATPEYAARISP